MRDDGWGVPPSGLEPSAVCPSFTRTLTFCGDVRPIAANFPKYSSVNIPGKNLPAGEREIYTVINFASRAESFPHQTTGIPQWNQVSGP